ncbi:MULTISPECIES: HK97 family phage prohead protease [Bacillus]|uniref:HK97 family phage prohead protease n=2 Tax=Bacillus thuringiensis TaxID=1428 RepID=A0A9X6V5F1_BACTU|nr:MULTISPECIES: HK97 family phage prohead protease [Bacillus cereus group]MEB4842075.1 HK97 family phage prohead protease [Paenibacillus jamilae]AJG61382.1 phage prohead protease, HK97 family [Bacillus cereus D17]EJR09207.1 HK97 family phage prohead protease [Bacillus cereus MSX-A1]KIP23511.1 phage prohead protease, HK97 family [Bacillus thuringiensis serovar morrisoni]MCR6850713.1 HK97 family phage prohead protease [Bacillus thuringiensis]
MAKTKETRTFDITKLSTRDATEEQPSKITGYAAVFNSKTTIGGWFDEVIEPGAFARSLSENGDIRALFNHNWDNVLGRTKSGTLRLEEDEKGLKFEIELPNTSVGRDLAESMSRGDINQCSFGFWITEENWDYSVEPALRTIKEVELYEISVVSIPAYDDTEVSLVRSKEIGKEIEQRMKMIKQINQILGEK